jgi:hypothetical protein
MDKFALVALASLTLAGCATPIQTAGTTAGAVGGAVVGGPVGAVVGGATGAVVTAPWSPFWRPILLSPSLSLPLVRPLRPRPLSFVLVLRRLESPRKARSRSKAIIGNGRSWRLCRSPRPAAISRIASAPEATTNGSKGPAHLRNGNLRAILA